MKTLLTSLLLALLTLLTVPVFAEGFTDGDVLFYGEVRQALERWGIPIPDPECWERPSPFQILAPDPLPEELLRHLYVALGLTIHHISILCGIGTTGVKGQLQRLGIPLRPPGPSPWTRRQIAS